MKVFGIICSIIWILFSLFLIAHILDYTKAPDYLVNLYVIGCIFTIIQAIIKFSTSDTY